MLYLGGSNDNGIHKDEHDDEIAKVGMKMISKTISRNIINNGSYHSLYGMPYHQLVHTICIT